MNVYPILMIIKLQRNLKNETVYYLSRIKFYETIILNFNKINKF